MNIFYIHRNPTVAAQMMVNSHVVKMIMESAQILSTAHRLLDGEMYLAKTKSGRNVKRWRLSDQVMEAGLCAATHINHPSVVWCRQSATHYCWLYNHFLGLLDEYTYRYDKVHAYASKIDLLKQLPLNIGSAAFTDPPPAMDKTFIISEDAVENYRNYYIAGKEHLHKWKKRDVPDWMLSK